MIQINLLPDVKLQFIRAKRIQKLITLVTFLVTGSAVGIFVLLILTTGVFQSNQIKSLSDEITATSKDIADTPDLDSILTIQKQLITLPGLHEAKPDTKRLFTYLAQVTPAEVKLSNLTVDYEASSMEIKGNATLLLDINTFVDTLKFTKFKTTESSSEESAFSSVVLKSFPKSENNGFSYEITLNFDPQIFSYLEKDLTLAVPNIVTTRSEIERPQKVFETPPAEEEAN